MKEFPPVPPLDWAGQIIAPGESYGGRSEHIKKQPPKNQRIITSKDLAEVFSNGAAKLTKASAAKLLAHATGSHRTSAYRALRLAGRFAKHLYTDGAKLGWRRGP